MWGGALWATLAETVEMSTLAATILQVMDIFKEERCVTTITTPVRETRGSESRDQRMSRNVRFYKFLRILTSLLFLERLKYVKEGISPVLEPSPWNLRVAMKSKGNLFFMYIYFFHCLLSLLNCRSCVPELPVLPVRLKSFTVTQLVG